MADLPAMRHMKNTLRDLASPFAAFLAEAVPATGGPDPLPEIVAAAEAEGAALIGGRPCSLRHGVEIPESLADPEDPFLPIPGPCRECGAAL